jgi:tetratricopeptide (TPR) repeat protein
MKIDVSFLDKLDSLIKGGQGATVGPLLEALKPAHVPREFRAPLAKIALRVGQTHFAFALLRPIVQSTRPMSQATTDEWLQYGMCLKQLGAADYALQIFERLNSEASPDVWLYNAITLFTQWRYREAIPKLRRYLADDRVTEYQKLIASVNLGSALGYEGLHDEAARTLAHVAATAARQNLALIHGNALELMARVKLDQGDFKSARTTIGEASRLIHKATPLYQFFLDKWRAVAHLFESGAAIASLRELDAVREKALTLQQWESVRDCDYYFAIGKVDRHLFLRLYFGTPYASYREKLLQRFSGDTSIPEYFDWRGNFFEKGVSREPGLIDFQSDTIGAGKNLLKRTHLVSRLLKALSADFYAPVRPFSLYLTLFPSEKLDAMATTGRIFTSVSRAKNWLKKNGIPIAIDSTEAGYQLRWHDSFILRVTSDLRIKDNDAEGLLALQRAFRDREFSSTEATKCLRQPLRTVRRFLNRAVAGQSLVVVGQKRATRYRLKKAKAA